jgi:hypothetical protein
MMLNPQSSLPLSSQPLTVAVVMLPPIHPACKVHDLERLMARAKALRKHGEEVKADRLIDAVQSAMLETTFLN